MLRWAVQAYKDFRYADVLFWADQVLSHGQATQRQQCQAMIWAGAAAYLRGEKEKARRYFRKVHALESHVVIPRNWFPEHLVRFFNDAVLHDR